MNESPVGAHSGDVTVRDLLSSLTALQALSMVMTDSKDEEEILGLAVSALRALTQHCRAEAVWLHGRWRPVGSLLQPGGDAAALEAQIVGLGSAGGGLHVSGPRWAWAFPLSSRGGASGYLVVGSPKSPPEHEWSLVQVLAQQTGVALANARLLASERAIRAQIANQQAALRRVAALVARAAPPEEVFAAVAAEAGRSREADIAVMSHYHEGGSATVVGAWVAGDGDQPLHVGVQLEAAEKSLQSLVFQTGQPARTDDLQAGDFGGHGLRSAVGVPIRIEERLWGVIALASRRQKPLPSDTEEWLGAFTELVATAIANAQAKVELRAFAGEEAALRRVATLVARSAAPEEVFAIVTAEVGRVVGADTTSLSRYDSGDSYTRLGSWSRTEGPSLPVGARAELTPRDVATLVYQTSGPARVDDPGDASDPATQLARALGIRSMVAAPISVEGRLWGVMTVGSREKVPLPPDTEARLAGFTELVATAIANAEARTALAASRARIVAAADAARQRMERDLHDGAQQRLVSLILRLRGAVVETASLSAVELKGVLYEAAAELDDVLSELRELARGLHPVALAEGGLERALKTLARRSALPVRLDVDVAARPPEQIELAAYYVVAETLTNAAKHSHALGVDVTAAAHQGQLRVVIGDDGRGGADPARGSGLVGLRDRVEALGGTFSVTSASTVGTTVEARFPLDIPRADPAL